MKKDRDTTFFLFQEEKKYLDALPFRSFLFLFL